MRAVIQRVSEARVEVEGKVTGEIGAGLLVLLGVAEEDTEADLEWLAAKIPQIRCFEDEEGKMNRSVKDIGGGILLVSQFTLYGNLRKGTRPSFNRSAAPEKAVPMYERMIVRLGEELGQSVATGRFGAMMAVHLINNGPVTLVLDTREKDF